MVFVVVLVVLVCLCSLVLALYIATTDPTQIQPTSPAPVSDAGLRRLGAIMQ